MLSQWDATVHWLQNALAGMADPWMIALALALTTLLLEDLAIAAGVALAVQGLISWPLSAVAVGGGIAAGDLGLYFMGLGATRSTWLHRKFVGDRQVRIRTGLVQGLPSAVVLARVIPGLRLLTYTACGYLRVPLLPFCTWVLVAVSVWTVGLYLVSVSVGGVIAEQFGIAPALAVALPVIVLAAAVPLVRLFQRRKGGPTP